MTKEKFNEWVDDVVEWYNKADKREQELFRNTEKENLCRFHHTLGRMIRNKFLLWEIPWTPVIIDGVDCAADHPDAISMAIIEEVWEKVKEKK